MNKIKTFTVSLIAFSILAGSAAVVIAAPQIPPHAPARDWEKMCELPVKEVTWTAICELRDRILTLEEKVVDLWNRIKTVQDEITALILRVTSLENWKITTEGLESRVQRIERIQMQQQWELVKSFPPAKYVMELEGTGNERTETFSVDEGGGMTEFYIMLDDFPAADENPFYKISLYKVGEESPMEEYQDEISLGRLEWRGWIPPSTEMRKFWEEHQGFGKVLPGLASGISGLTFEGPGEFYWEIEIENVDHWFLRVGENGG